MTIATLRTPKGKMIHATKVDPILVSDQTGMAEVMCGKEYTGILSETESPEGVTCPRCHDRLMAELAAELAEVEAQMAIHGEPVVLMTPEAIAEHTEKRRRYKTPGRIRHGRIVQQRAERRRMMKAVVANVR